MSQLDTFRITRSAGCVAEQGTVVRCAFFKGFSSLRGLTALDYLFEAVEFDSYRFTGCELGGCWFVKSNQEFD